MKALFLSLMLTLSISASAQTWLIDVDKVPAKSFTREISKITGKNFIIDDSVSDIPITLTTRKHITPDEVLDYYTSAMSLHNIRVINNGDKYIVSKNSGNAFIYKLNHADAETVAKIINDLSLNGVKVVADISNNSLLINSPMSNDFQELIKQLDVKRKQVLIQAVILEVSADDINQLGVQWALGGKNGYGVVNFNPAVSLTSILSGNKSLSVLGGLLGYSKQNNNNEFYGAVLQALEQTTSANLLSMPSVVALDNEQASILIGQNIPVLTGSQLDKNGEPFQTFSRLDVGISLRVVPTVASDGSIKLKVYQEVSNVTNATNEQGVITNKAVIETLATAHDGQTIVLGGLMRDYSTTDNQAIPKVSKIPILGRAFKSDSQTAKKSNLLVFLSPKIIDSSQNQTFYNVADSKKYKLTFNNGEFVREVIQ